MRCHGYQQHTMDAKLLIVSDIVFVVCLFRFHYKYFYFYANVAFRFRKLSVRMTFEL